jgi:hypothetical protein
METTAAKPSSQKQDVTMGALCNLEMQTKVQIHSHNRYDGIAKRHPKIKGLLK